MEQSHLDPRIATSESTHSTQQQGWELQTLRNFEFKFSNFFLSDISPELQKFEHSHLEAKISTPESTLTAPNIKHKKRHISKTNRI